MITIEALHKSFGVQPVLQGLSATLRPGRVTAVVGPNGTGKTTLIKCVLGLMRPDGGTIHVEGRPLNGAAAYRAGIGYMPQEAVFPENLTAREVLALLCDLRGHTALTDTALLDGFGLAGEMDKPLGTLSGGTRQKVNAVIAFGFAPRILLLDEPTAGLDPVASSLLKDAILQARQRGSTIVLTSHIMSEIEELADHIIFLLHGRVWYEGATEAVKAQTGEDRLERAIAQLLRRVAA